MKPIKQVLVTGGAGYVGGVSVEAILDAGHQVVVLDDLSTGHAENLPADVDLVVGSVADAECVAGAMDGIEAVFHEGARGSVARSVEDPLTTDTMNTHGTLTVLVHPNTGQELEDHRDRPLWIGKSQTLKPSIFTDPPKE